MITRVNYYQNLSADYSKPRLVSEEKKKELLELSKHLISLKEPSLPDMNAEYSPAQVEKENREWWPTHCEALRQGRGDLLLGEYRDDLVYFCQDGAFRGLEEQKSREIHWWALIAQPGVTMTWPIVMFHHEFIHFEWACIDDVTTEIVAKGSACVARRGHRGAWYFKSEQLSFFRDVFASKELLDLLPKKS